MSISSQGKAHFGENEQDNDIDDDNYMDNALDDFQNKQPSRDRRGIVLKPHQKSASGNPAELDDCPRPKSFIA